MRSHSPFWIVLRRRIVKNDTSFLNEDPFKPNLYNTFGNPDLD